MSRSRPSPIARLLRFTSKIEAQELLPCAVSFLLVFLLMSSYYILRPVRDAMASDWSDAEVSFLWTLNFFLSTAAVAGYGWIVSRIRFQHLVPGVYGVFVASFVLFYFGEAWSSTHRTLVDKTFYVWVSVYSLFHISVFWSFMSDVYRSEQAVRLFPVIGAGASAGALVGPAVPTLLAEALGTQQLMLLAAALLLPTILLVLYISRLKITRLENSDLDADLSAARIGGNPLAGFREFMADPFLLAIGGFIMLYTAVASIAYFQRRG